MTPKEIAEELVNKYLNASFNCKGCEMLYCDISCTQLSKNDAKQCALITVDEISKHCYEVMKPFWQQVKDEILNL